MNGWLHAHRDDIDFWLPVAGMAANALLVASLIYLAYCLSKLGGNKVRRQRCTFYLPGGQSLVEKFEGRDLHEVIARALARKSVLEEKHGRIGHSLDCFKKPLWKRFWDWLTW